MRCETKPRTLYQKLWDGHMVARRPGEPALLYIDLHLIHEVTSPQAFAELHRRGLAVRRPDRTIATADHAVPTAARPLSDDPEGSAQIAELAMNCEAHAIRYFGPGDERQGIVHVIGPELGLTRPGMTIVCGDSHTATHGAFGALAFGIGTSEVAQALATQCLPQHPSPTYEIRLEGRLPAGVSAKDLILAIIARIGVAGATGHVIEYAGEAVRALSMEERMTVCNMSIEAGARAGMIAPDETTFRYLRDRPFAPRGRDWEAALARWKRLPSDPGARHDRSLALDAAALAPMITYGTHPGMSIAVDGRVPDPEHSPAADRDGLVRALRYMDLQPGKPLLERPIGTVFLGSCTNSRLSDLREAAGLLRGRRVHPRVRMLVVPGSRAVARAAEAEGLDRVFRDAGAQWREPGCSMCIAMNGDRLEPGELCVSTSNRNFEGRQGPGGRTLLASPLTAAASAVAGAVADPRRLEALVA